MSCNYCNELCSFSMINDCLPGNYCSSCFFEQFKDAKILINKKEEKINIEYEIPIIVINESRYDGDRFLTIYVLYKEQISKDLFNILNCENSIVDGQFFWECDKINKGIRCLKNFEDISPFNIFYSIILKYKSFDKIIHIKNDKIKYITYQELIDM